ncbi:peptidoglycan-binding protein [Cognatiyoonia sp.]|uniref:peptidoglycan-binding protein n=1 Tax=Cognatiyoonia sp. TaxID=2211652 RepID=UPI003F698E5B
MRNLLGILAIAISASSASAGNDTATAQELLNKLGLNAGPVDGAWGPRTDRAIHRFYTEIGAIYDGELDAQDIVTLEAATSYYRHFGNRDWSPEIRSELHEIKIDAAPFSYINENLVAALVGQQQFSEPNLGNHPIGEPPNVEWVQRPMDADCAAVLRDMSPPDMSRWDAPLYAQNCNYNYRLKMFDGGIDALQGILDHWASQPLGAYDLKPSGDDAYFKSTLMASVGTTYALFYDHFKNHGPIDRLISDWMLNNQTLVGRETCPFSKPESYTPDRYIVDACGSNHWRLSVANIALGLRLKNRQLFIAGVKHLEINLSMYDADGIFTPYATRGWDSPGYAIDNNEYISSIALMLSEVGVNLYDFKIHDGRDIGTLIEGHNAWLNDPSLAEKYIVASTTCNGGTCTQIGSMEDLGPLAQWKIDRQFEDFDILLRSFHYQVVSNGADPVELARIYPRDGENGLAKMYVWGQTSAFPFIYASLEYFDDLERYLEPEPQEPLDLEGIPLDFVNLECDFEIRRKLIDGAEENRIASGRLITKEGRVAISEIEIRVGENPNPNFVMDTAELFLAEDGRIIGDLAVYTMFGNDRIDVIRLGTSFAPFKNKAKIGPQGTHLALVDKTIEISLVAKGCQ